MKKKKMKMQLRSDAIVVLDSKRMSNIVGKGLGDVCEIEGIVYNIGETFWYKNNICECREGPVVHCTVVSPPEPPEGCWCTCKCFEATVVGFQLGMIAPQKRGDL